MKNIPKSTTVHVSAYAINPTTPESLKNVLYKEKVLSFEVTYVSKIKVESYYRNGVQLSKDYRTASIKVFSNTQFTVKSSNLNEEDRGYDLLKFKVNKTDEDSSEYFLTITVPQEITHDFDSQLILEHPGTGMKTIIPVTF